MPRAACPDQSEPTSIIVYHATRPGQYDNPTSLCQQATSFVLRTPTHRHRTTSHTRQCPRATAHPDSHLHWLVICCRPNQRRRPCPHFIIGAYPRCNWPRPSTRRTLCMLNPKMLCTSTSVRSSSRGVNQHTPSSISVVHPVHPSFSPSRLLPTLRSPKPPSGLEHAYGHSGWLACSLHTPMSQRHEY